MLEVRDITKIYNPGTLTEQRLFEHFSLTVEEGQRAAYNCMLNLLANLNDKTGDLNRIKRFVKILAFVNSADDFGMQPQVVNGGSNLIAQLFGEEAGLPARSATGTNALPGGIACEIEVLVELK